MIRLLALDLDGTVLTNDKQITAPTREAILHAADAGIEVVFVTGRPFSGLPAELSVFSEISRYVITSNGAVTFDRKEKKPLRTAFLDNAAAEHILKLSLKQQLLYNIFIDGYGFSHKEMHETLIKRFTNTALDTYVRQSRRPAGDMFALLQGEASKVENIWIRAKDKEERDRVNETVKKLERLQTVLTAETDVEISAPDADKGIALKQLAISLNIPKDEVLAIGDNENDLSMFAEAGTSVAMGNASEAVKARADGVTASNQNDGAAFAIRQFCR